MFINRMIVLFVRRYSRHFTPAGRTDHPVTLQCRVTVNGRAASKFSTNLRLLPHHWDQTTQRATPDCPLQTAINSELQRITSRLYVLWNNYEYQQLPVTADELVDELLNRQRKTPMRPESAPPASAKAGRTELGEVLRKHLAGLKKRIVADSEHRDFGILLETYRVYERYTVHIKLYLADSPRPHQLATHLDAVWMNELLDYMRLNNYDGYYIAKHLYFVKTALNWAVDAKLLRFNPITHYKIERAEKKDAELVFLYDDELARLRAMDFTTHPTLSSQHVSLTRVRDGFLAMVELGQHHKDYVTFVKNPVPCLRTVHGVRFFRKRRQKTKQWALVPISDELCRLETLYGGLDKLPRPSNKTFNQALKLIAGACGINKNLSTKAARKTFADQNINEEDIDLDTVARMMGLSSTQYIQKYARIDERRIMTKKGLSSNQTPPPADKS